MSEINPIAGHHGATAPQPVHRVKADGMQAQAHAASQARMEPQDRVELSEHARHLERLRNLPEIRQSKVEAARSAIADGIYESPDRLRAALLRMLDEIETG
jgi:flagellar biosynthesis anti-sigma factor FlgM